jgi:20S proteasome subunit alpha 6
MARTYLERNLEAFEDCGKEELVKHGLRALKESLAQDKELTVENCSVGVVGLRKEGAKGIEGFKLYDGEEVKVWVDLVAEAAEAADGESMEVDA